MTQKGIWQRVPSVGSLHDFSEFTTEGLRESSWSQKTLDRTVQELSDDV